METIIGLLGIVVGAITALVATQLEARRSAQLQEREWHRQDSDRFLEMRQKTYVQLLQTVRAFQQVMQTAAADSSKWQAELHHALVDVMSACDEVEMITRSPQVQSRAFELLQSVAAQGEQAVRLAGTASVLSDKRYDQLRQVTGQALAEFREAAASDLGMRDRGVATP